MHLRNGFPKVYKLLSFMSFGGLRPPYPPPGLCPALTGGPDGPLDPQQIFPDFRFFQLSPMLIIYLIIFSNPYGRQSRGSYRGNSRYKIDRTNKPTTIGETIKKTKNQAL